MVSDRGPLHAATVDLHHAVEQTALGQAMASGTVSAQAWADWLEVLFVLHDAVDEWLPRPLRRAEMLLDDLKDSPPARFTEAVEPFLSELWDEKAATGAGYVLCGAHLMGGKVIAARIGTRLPTRHLRFEDRKAALAAFVPLRERGDCLAGAKGCFRALLAVAEEIEGRGGVAAQA